MTNISRFWPHFWDAARRSHWPTIGAIVLTIFSVVGGTVFWLVGLPSWAVFMVMFVAVVLAPVVVYHIASLVWMAQADALTKTRGELQAASEQEPLLDLGSPKLLEHGVLPRTQLRGPIETSVGTGGPRYRIPIGQRQIRNYRIPITNHGAPAQEVRVKVVEISPDVEGVSEDVTLHITNDDPPLENHTYRSSFSLARGETMLLDMVAMDERKPEVCYIWNIAFDDAVQEVRLGGTHVFAIRAYAGNVSKDARYRVYADSLDRRLDVEGPLMPK